MTVINHKSISGITSITAPAGSDDLLTVHTNDTTERFRIVDSGAIVTGVTTASNFKTGTTNVHNVGVELAGINVLGADTPIGTGATIYNSGAAVFTGVVTATSFSGAVTATKGIDITAGTSNLYQTDGSLSYYAANNGVYLNGAGANGWLRLQAAGTANDRTSINLNGHSKTNGDEIYFKTNSTERLRIKSGGKVGIGTDNPSQKVSIASGRVNIDIKNDHYGVWFDGDTTGENHISVGRWYNTGGGLKSGYSQYGINNLILENNHPTAAHTLIIQPKGQKVAIGTHISDGLVHIGQTSAGSVSANAGGDELVLESSGNTGLSILSPGTGESTIFFGNPGTNGERDGYIRYWHESHSTTANRRCLSFIVGGGDNERLRITSGGKIGINEDVPQGFLHVAGTSNYSDVYLSNSTSGHTGSDGANIFLNNNLELGLWNKENAPIRFATAGTEKMRLTNDGPHLLLGGTDDVNEITEGATNAGIVIGNTSTYGNAGIAIITKNDGCGRIYFGDGVTNSANRGRGSINYYHNGDYMDIYTAGDRRLRITDVGRVNIGPDAADIQIIPHSTSSGHGQIYLRGNATNESSSIKLNHYGHADYVIGSGRHSNGMFSITRSDTGTDGLLMNNLGKVGVGKVPETLTGNGFNAKLQVNTGASNDYDGILIGGGYTRSTIQNGATYDLVLTSNAYPANATSKGIRFLCGSSGGGGPNERMRIHQSGMSEWKQHGGSKTYEYRSSVTGTYNQCIIIADCHAYHSFAIEVDISGYAYKYVWGKYYGYENGSMYAAGSPGHQDRYSGSQYITHSHDGGHKHKFLCYISSATHPQCGIKITVGGPDAYIDDGDITFAWS